MPELIISVSGLRGIVGESLTPEVARSYAAAFAAETPPGPIVLARDGRESGPLFAEAIAKALAAAGRDVLDAGVCATPTVGVLVRTHRAAGGVQISASHNPPEYNGMKLFGAEGCVISAAEGGKVADRYRSESWPSSQAPPGGVRQIEDATTAHRDLVLATVDVPRIRGRRFRVLVDSNHGAGSVLGKKLLAELGCESKWLGDAPDGRFDHPPEPTEENLAGVASQAAGGKFDVCFCQDPDADRLAIIDENGRYIGEEYTLALCVAHVLGTAAAGARGRLGPVVANCSSSRMSEDLAARFGVPFFRSPVGEANVTAVMRREDAAIGGEGSGGAIDPRVGYVRDSFVGMALVLDAMAGRQLSLSRLVGELPRYAIAKEKATLPKERVPAAFDALERAFADARSDRSDGLRLDWPDRWLLVRASNTEPIVRIVAEAPAAEAAEGLCRQAREALISVSTA